MAGFTRLRSRLQAVTVFLGIGAVANVTIAWALAAFLPQHGWSENHLSVWDKERGHWILKTEFRTIGAVRRTWETGPPLLLRFPPFALAITDSVRAGHDEPEGSHFRGLRWGNTEEIATSDQRL